MMKALAILVLCFYAGDGQEVKAGSLTVSMYFEGDCPDCHQYLREQLLQAWTGPFLQSNQTLLELVPFGNAEQRLDNGRWRFKCQHGPEECRHNKLYACAIHQVCGEGGTVGCQRLMIDQVLGYILCVAGQDDQFDATPECTKDLPNLRGELVQQCALSELGSLLLSQHGNRTAACSPPVEYVPWISINGEHDTAAEENLISRMYELKPDLRNGTAALTSGTLSN